MNQEAIKRFGKIERPNNNPTEAENELNLMMKIVTTAYILYRQGYMDEATYKHIEDQIESCKQIIINMEQ